MPEVESFSYLWSHLHKDDEYRLKCCIVITVTKILSLAVQWRDDDSATYLISAPWSHKIQQGTELWEQ